MNPQNRIERSDTFGANTRADLELLRRINDRANDHRDEVLALIISAAAILTFLGIVGAISFLIWS